MLTFKFNYRMISIRRCINLPFNSLNNASDKATIFVGLFIITSLQFEIEFNIFLFNKFKLFFCRTSELEIFLTVPQPVFISFHFILFYFILFHFILFHFILFHFILFHFILFVHFIRFTINEFIS